MSTGQIYFCCRDCYCAFPNMNVFINHWKNQHEKNNRNNGLEDNTDSSSDSGCSSATSSTAIGQSYIQTRYPPEDDNESDNNDMDDKYSDRCLIVGDKQCTVNMGSLYHERHLMVLKSKIHGRGLFTGNYIRKGELIIEYYGRVVGADEALALQSKYDRRRIDNYIMRLGKLYIDATVSGNCARYTNNSCNPNCSTNVITFLGKKKVFIYALRDILCGEELTYDYQFSANELVPCNCRSFNCRGALNWNIDLLQVENIKDLLKNF